MGQALFLPLWPCLPWKNCPCFHHTQEPLFLSPTKGLFGEKTLRLQRRLSCLKMAGLENGAVRSRSEGHWAGVSLPREKVSGQWLSAKLSLLTQWKPTQQQSPNACAALAESDLQGSGWPRRLQAEPSWYCLLLHNCRQQPWAPSRTSKAVHTTLYLVLCPAQKQALSKGLLLLKLYSRVNYNNTFSFKPPCRCRCLDVEV